MLALLYSVDVTGQTPSGGETGTLQQLIDAAQPGETIQLKAGEYRENLVIDKPLHLMGTDNVTLVNKGARPTLTLEANQVKVENLTIIHEGRDSPAILVRGDHNTLHNLKIYTNSFGLRLDEAQHNTMTHLAIEGDKRASFTERKHGIDLWRSHHNEIDATQIKYVTDGIYMEKSKNNRLRGNTVAYSRYGYHLMFTENTLLEANEAHHNVSGMMIMGTVGTVAKHNKLYNNHLNVRSLGLYLFDVKQAHISHNHILNNRVGILIEDSQQNELTQNVVRSNYLGLQFIKARDNHIYQNAFVANVVQGQAEESHHNIVEHNYWGDHVGLDLNGDGTSNLPYSVDPFFLKITDQYPPFQLFFHSPGLIFLENLIHIPFDQQLIDQAPLLANPLIESDKTADTPLITLLVCSALLLISTLLIYQGVRIK